MKTVDHLFNHKSLVNKFLTHTSFSLSSFSFVNIFIWADFFDFEFEEINDCLCVFATNHIGTFLYLPPLGKAISSQAIQKVFDFLCVRNNISKVSRIENVEEHQIRNFSNTKFVFTKKAHEFVYKREAISALTGQSYKSKRSSYNQFCRKHSSFFLPYEEKMREDCLMLYDRWACSRKEVQTDGIAIEMLRENRLVHSRAMEHYKFLDLIGRVAIVDGTIAGYSFGYALTPRIFCVLFEVAELNFKGIATFIFKEFCSDPEIQSYDEINVMDDFGLENIHRVKKSFRPCQVIPSYVVSLKEEGACVCG